MKISQKKGYHLRHLKPDMLVDISFILYFCSPFIKAVISRICAAIGYESLESVIIICIVYLPLLFACLIAPKKVITFDFMMLWSGIIIFFAVTYLLHPEYIDRYSDPVYGVWSYVLIPIEGLYAYWFIRLMDSPARIFRNLKYAGWIMYIYFFYQVYSASVRGYWEGVTVYSANTEMSYSVSFGYNVLLFTLPFLYQAIMYKRFSDIAGAVIGIFMIVTQGSRGPVLFIAVFLFMLGLVYFGRSRIKWLLLTLAILPIILIYIFYDKIIAFLITLLSSANIDSRFVTMLLNGTIIADNGRSIIWNAALEMIKEKPLFGYGAMGSQHVISNVIPAGYPHSIILEFMIDFGSIIGCVLAVFLLYNASSMLFKKKNRKWCGIFLVIFVNACQLFISMCYWSTTAFWASIAIGVNCYLENRRSKIRKTTYLARSDGNMKEGIL